MSVDRKILEIVWAETTRLVPANGSGSDKARLQAVVGALAERDRALGSTANYARSRTLPESATPGGDAVGEMQTVVDNAVSSQQHAGVALPGRAVIWEVTQTGEPRESERQLPAWATWIKDVGPTRSSDFNIEGDNTKRVFRLFESDAAPPVNGVRFVSGLSGSGVPAPVYKINYLSAPWILGIFATLLFIWMIVAIGWTGRTATQARDLLLGTQPEHTQKLTKGMFAICATGPSVPAGGPQGTQPTRSWIDTCSGDGAPDPNKVDASSIPPAMAKCATDMGNAEATPKVAPLMSRSLFCRRAWIMAHHQANSAEMTNLPWPFGGVFVFLSRWFAKASETTGSISLALPMFLMLLSIALLVVALGLGKKGRAFGVWINQENRMSLARMQASLWTIVVLGAFAAMALFNIGMLSEPLRALNIVAEGTNDQAAVTQAKAFLAKIVTFPQIPAMILAALGIAVGSMMISALIKSGAPKSPSVDLQEGAQKVDKSGLGRFIDPSGDGTLETRPSEQYASLADFFIGEHESDKNLIDVSRLQNVVITVILVGGYATLLFGQVRDIAPDVIVRALHDYGALFPSLPDPGGIFTTLLAASHATYLVAKRATTNQ